jgi:APA family basic amino acid/polyamine antiporter
VDRPRATATEPRPRRELGLLDATSMVVGNVVGAGIFLVSGMVASHVTSAATFLALWVIGGLVALAGAFANGELGALFPRGGGEYVYLREAYGPLLGFLSGWASFWIGFPGSGATLAYGFSAALVHAFGLGGRSTVSLIAIASVVALTALNARGIRPGKWLQNVLSLGKVLLLVAFVLVGFAWIPGAPPTESAAPEPSSGPLVLAFALLPILFSYSGWNVATYVAGEMRDPRRTLGRALVLGTSISVALYLAVNALYLHALSLPGLRAVNEPALVSFGRLSSSGVGTALGVLVAFSILGSLQATLVAGPRIYQAMAEDGLFFGGLARLGPKTRVPENGLFAQGAIAIVLLSSGSFERLLTFTTFAIVVFSTLTVAAVPILRRRLPVIERPFKTPLYPFVPLLFIAANVLVAVAVVKEGPVEAALGLAIVGAGVPIFYAFRGRFGSRQPHAH